MEQKQIEEAALQLPIDARAGLAKKLLLSLESPDEEEVAKEWLAEAQRRARELDDGTAIPIPAEEVRRKARALFR